MSKTLLLIASLFTVLSVYSQKTKLIKEYQKKESKNNVDSFLVKSYYVFESEEKLKHGYYREFYTNGNLKVYGYYSNDKKEKKWIYSNEDGSVSERGEFKDGTKIGVWETHNKENGLVEKYDFTKKKKLITIGHCKITYPYLARAAEIQGIVKIKASLDANCKLEKLEIIEGIGGGCDEEALRVIKKGFEIAEKYNANVGCSDKTEVFEINFKLRE